LKILIKTFSGLENILKQEIENLGGTSIEILKRAVAFEGEKIHVYRANYELRTALRVLIPIIEFEFSSADQLYQKSRNIPWLNYLSHSDTFAIDAVVQSDIFKHSNFPALKIKDAIVDELRTLDGKRPSVDTRQPSLRIHAHIYKNKCSISLDSSGKSLHKRGYRATQNEAPLNEVLASGMVMLSGWNPSIPFLDPMCGSGTLLIEAAAIATQRPPQFLNPEFGFMRWNDFDYTMWKSVKTSADNQILTGDKWMIYGRDIDAKAIKITSGNIFSAGFEKMVTLEKKEFEQSQPKFENGTLIINPPYDERMGLANIHEFYKTIGDTLKSKYQNHTAWILTSNEEAIKNIGLKASRKITLFNGPLECKYLKYELYTGSKKTKFQ
jgi:putative N6-adenine-specific DNA methylase